MEAFKALEQAESFEEKVAASDRMGANNVGESIDVIQNCDLAFILNRLRNPVVNEAGEIEYQDRFLSIKMVASRIKEPKFSSIKHRFAENNDMDLVDDINFPRSLSVITSEELIKDRLKTNKQVSTRRKVC